MPGWNSKRFAAYGWVLVVAGLSAGLQVGCHKRTHPDDLTQPPTVVHGIPDMLATQGVPFASVTPQVRAWVYTEGVGSWVTSGFSFSVQPALPGGFTLDPKTGQTKEENPAFIKAGDAAIVTVKPTKPMVIEPVKEIPQLGRFAIRDMGMTIAAGMCMSVKQR